MITMQCPDCGYDADDAAVFCPQCRYQFRDIIEEEPLYTADTLIDLPERGIITDERVLDEDLPPNHEIPAAEQRFSAKEIVQLDIQLLQPSMLVVLIVALVAYSVLSAVPFIPLTWDGISFSITGLVCLAAGLFSGLVFFLLVRHSLRSSRYH